MHCLDVTRVQKRKNKDEDKKNSGEKIFGVFFISHLAYSHFEKPQCLQVKQPSL